MRVHAFIQAHHSDFRCFSQFDGKTYLQHVVSKAQLMPEIHLRILVVPDCDRNRVVFGEIASRDGIQVFYGDVENRLQRFVDCADEFNTDIIVRLPAVKPLFRTELASKMINTLLKKTDIDFITVPSDFPKLFSCEVMRSSALRRAIPMLFLSNEEVAVLSSAPHFAVERLLSSDRIARITEGLPRISESEIDLARELRRQELALGGAVLAESEKHLESARYLFAANFVRETDSVLDVACGSGLGCGILSKTAKHGKVVGVDLEKKGGEFAGIERCHHNVRFLVGDAMKIDMDTVFDRVVSFETIEHLEQPGDFLLRLRDVLSTDGLMILSVPRGMSPAYLSRPLNPYHVKEYSAPELLELLSNCGFVIDRRFMQDEVGLVEEGWRSDVAGSFIAVCRKSLRQAG